MKHEPLDIAAAAQNGQLATLDDGGIGSGVGEVFEFLVEGEYAEEKLFLGFGHFQCDGLAGGHKTSLSVLGTTPFT